MCMQAAKKLNQTYTFVTMDLAAAKIAFDIKFDDAERFYRDYSYSISNLYTGICGMHNNLQSFQCTQIPICFYCVCCI